MKKRTSYISILGTLVLLSIGVNTIETSAETTNTMYSQGRFETDDKLIVFDARDFATLEQTMEQGKEAAYNIGREEGINEVKASPSSYGITTSVICLGTVRNYDLSSYEGYKSWTKDNFLVVSGNFSLGGNKTHANWNYHTEGIFEAPVVNYNNSTGQLSITGGKLTANSYSINLKQDVDQFFSGNVPVTVYLIP